MTNQIIKKSRQSCIFFVQSSRAMHPVDWIRILQITIWRLSCCRDHPPRVQIYMKAGCNPQSTPCTHSDQPQLRSLIVDVPFESLQASIFYHIVMSSETCCIRYGLEMDDALKGQRQRWGKREGGIVDRTKNNTQNGKLSSNKYLPHTRSGLINHSRRVICYMKVIFNTLLEFRKRERR